MSEILTPRRSTRLLRKTKEDVVITKTKVSSCIRVICKAEKKFRNIFQVLFAILNFKFFDVKWVFVEIQKANVNLISNLIQSVRKTKQPLQNSTNTKLGDVIEETQVLSEKLSEIESLHREIAELKAQNSALTKQVEKLEVDKHNLESVNQNLIGTGLFIFTCLISIYFWNRSETKMKHFAFNSSFTMVSIWMNLS